MERIAFIIGNRFFYWNSIVLTLAAAGAICLFLAFYLPKGRSGTAAAAVPMALVLSVFFARLVHWYFRPDSYEGFAAAMAAEKMTDEQIEELLCLADEYADAVTANDPIKVLYMDEAFHNFIFECSENDTLLKLSEIVQERAQRFRYLYYDKLGRYQNMPLEHREIATSIAERNVEKARELSEGHARRLKEFIINAEDVISRI